jgi:hypothetical protein
MPPNWAKMYSFNGFSKRFEMKIVAELEEEKRVREIMGIYIKLGWEVSAGVWLTVEQSRCKV